VVGAIQEILFAHNIAIEGKEIVVVGAGALVGKPIALWLLGERVTYAVIRSSTEHPERFLASADIVMSGIGRPGFIRGEHLKNGVVVIDAGTSESAGKLVGDADIASLDGVASYITPVPGGIGPLTVAVLLRNLMRLTQRKR
jgi:methylenetetrahydrofolate dehydrogenase (NADP+)/methenyltetrahydrofolate cyclohydrolase